MIHTFSDNKHYWDVKKLWTITKDFDSFDWEIPESLLNDWYWGSDTPSSHVRRVMSADLSFPIILHGDGIVVDGMHRICKALFNGQKTIKAVRLDNLPDPEGVVEKSYGKPETWTYAQLIEIMRLANTGIQDANYLDRHPLDGI
jgi:hypothetical protein